MPPSAVRVWKRALHLCADPSDGPSSKGFGITGSCQTVNAATLEYAANNNGSFPAYDGGVSMPTFRSGFGDLPPWSTNSFGPGTFNDGVPVNTAVGACILSNGFPFSYYQVGNIFWVRLAALHIDVLPALATRPPA